MTALPQAKLTLDDFLAWENAQPERHEFHRGEVFAAEAAGRVHGTVVSNLICRVSQRLTGTPGQVFAHSMKIQIADDTILYPDVFVTCDKADLATEMIFRAPTVIFEVLSPSTQAYDRSQKFALYRRVPALKEYVLIDPETRRVEAFRVDANGRWYLHDMSDGTVLHLLALAIELPLAEIFDGIDPAA